MLSDIMVQRKKIYYMTQRSMVCDLIILTVNLRICYFVESIPNQVEKEELAIMLIGVVLQVCITG